MVGTLEARKYQETECNALFLPCPSGDTIIELNGYRYKKSYKTKQNTVKWKCSKYKNCSGCLYLNDKDDVVFLKENHTHPKGRSIINRTFKYALKTEDLDKSDKDEDSDDGDDSTKLIKSRKGKDILLYRQHTYRKQYDKCGKRRWVCSNTKFCRAAIFTDNKNVVLKAFEDHCHDPPKYYSKPEHLIEVPQDTLQDVDGK